MNERLNIRRMQMPEQHDENLRFDAKRDISEAELSLLHEEMQKKRQAVGGIDKIAHFASRLQVVDTKKLFMLGEDERKKIRGLYESATGLNNWKDYLEVGASARLLWPDEDMRLDSVDRFGFTEKVRAGVRDSLDGYRDHGFRDMFFTYSLYAYIVDPKTDWRFGPDQLAGLMRLKGLTVDEYAPNSIAAPALALAAMHVVYPGLRNATDAEWSAMKEALRYNSPTRGLGAFNLDYVDLCLAMKILSADTVQFVNGKGLQFENVKNHKESVAPQPHSLEL